MERDTAAGDPANLEARSGLSHDAVREQLDRILAHREFHATDKMRDFLRFVVEETLAGRKHRIKGYTVATRVFCRDDDFDPGQDPIVSIQAGRLRRALERYYLVAGGRDPIHIDIPKGRYIPRFTEQAVAPNQDRHRRSTDKVLGPELINGPSIAVMRFDDLTGNPDQQFMAVGLTEELATEMNRFQDIAVIPCQGASGCTEQLVDSSEFGASIGARFILHGSVRRDAEVVKVSVHLSDARDGHQIWAEAYTHPLDASRLIATQEEIARSVVAAIASEYGIIARRLSAESRKKPPAELETYEAMLRYYSHQIAPSNESAASCFVALQSAAEREPEYGSVWSALATLHCQMYSFDVPGFEDALGKALDFARKGVFLEPGSQLGRMILAYASYLAEDSESFLEESETALNLNPNSPYTVGAIGFFHVHRGEIDRGLSLLDRAISVSPCHPAWFHTGYIIDQLYREDYEQALIDTRKHLPFLSFWDDVAQAAILGKLGRADEATIHIGQIVEQKPDFTDRARELMRRSLKIDPLIDDLIDGLQRGGMRVEPS